MWVRYQWKLVCCWHPSHFKVKFGLKWPDQMLQSFSRLKRDPHFQHFQTQALHRKIKHPKEATIRFKRSNNTFQKRRAFVTSNNIMDFHSNDSVRDAQKHNNNFSFYLKDWCVWDNKNFLVHVDMFWLVQKSHPSSR